MSSKLRHILWRFKRWNLSTFQHTAKNMLKYLIYIGSGYILRKIPRVKNRSNELKKDWIYSFVAFFCPSPKRALLFGLSERKCNAIWNINLLFDYVFTGSEVSSPSEWWIPVILSSSARYPDFYAVIRSCAWICRCHIHQVVTYLPTYGLLFVLNIRYHFTCVFNWHQLENWTFSREK